jgi:dephospho-CoA kinase
MSLIIGLTGGIASGKSTVATMLKDLDIPIIDADEEARVAVEPGKEAYTKIVAHFGEEIISEDGSIDRAKLGAIIFHNKEKRNLLNSIVHPAVREQMLEKKEHYKQQGYLYIVMDIPLLFESQLTAMVDKVIVVYVDEDIQLKRLMQRNGFTEVEAKARIASQMPLREKRELADAVINNNGSVEETKKQLDIILKNWGFSCLN